MRGLLVLIGSIACCKGYAWSGHNSVRRQPKSGVQTNDTTFMEDSQRRNMIASAILSPLIIKPQVSNAIRAVGGAEIKCREEGNCLEKGEIDGALGWNWGALDRCDAADANCGPDGILRELQSLPAPPKIKEEVSHIINLVVAVGREETLNINIGLYGQEFPGLVGEIVSFCDDGGLVTSNKLILEDGYGIKSAPVSLKITGLMTLLVPSSNIFFGVPSQSAAYARRIGKSKPGDDFVPQARPSKDRVSYTEREYDLGYSDIAGLLCVPSDGLGFGGGALESEDEAFTTSFALTVSDAGAKQIKREGWKVIGAVMDDESMYSIARLGALPTRKGITGIIPGQNSGPPLVKVSIKNASVVVKNNDSI